jgi:alkanesulfonate monooxygenase SsuD/methylene tetrahydromethanopterin reductase-like flavin-dependent oxidoreductase (luciferase family)
VVKRRVAPERLHVLTLRFDMRVPGWAGSADDLYSAAIEMCGWAESRGAFLAVLSEHHGADDGHLPTPLLLASAIAARTTTLAILLAAVPIPFWDPVRLAEEINVLDLISRGRVSYAFGIGHRAEEYEHFGVDMTARGRLADDYLAAVLALVKGESVQLDGRQVRVTPRGTSQNGPAVMIAGGSVAGVRRAARNGLGFISQVDNPELRQVYDEECRANGHEPGFVQFPVAETPTTVFVADDLDKAWRELGPHLLHDATMAASYRHGDDSVASITRADTVESLRSAVGPYRVMTVDEAVEYIRGGRPLPLHPLCGGVAPDVAWRYLEFATAAVERATSSPSK